MHHVRGDPFINHIVLHWKCTAWSSVELTTLLSYTGKNLKTQSTPIQKVATVTKLPNTESNVPRCLLRTQTNMV
jgi:hypothetical protein